MGDTDYYYSCKLRLVPLVFCIHPCRYGLVSLQITYTAHHQRPSLVVMSVCIQQRRPELRILKLFHASLDPDGK
jgi:hypothetical protein